jgi:hypothetical protein
VAVAALLGKTDEARAAGARALAISPTFSITSARERSFYPEKFEFMFEGFRLAGLPE